MGYKTFSRSARSAFVYLTLCVGIIFSALIFLYSYRMETKSIQNEFNLLASDRARVIINGVGDNLALLKAVQYFYASSQVVERDEFHEFTSQILIAHPEIYEFRWLQRVPGLKRQELEETVGREGINNFYIKDLDKDGNIIKAGLREEYFPVYFLEPWDKTKEDVIGLDSGSIPQRWQAMEKARDTAAPVLVAESGLVGEPRFKTATRILIPVYVNSVPHETLQERRNNLSGFLVILFNMESMVEILLKDMRGRGLDTYVYDTTLAEGNRLVLFDYSRARGKRIDPLFSEEQLKNFTGIAWQGSFSVADSTWTIICRPAPAFFKKYNMRQPWVILGICLFVTAIIVLYLNSLIRRTAVIEALVEQKTEELRSVQAQLLQSSKMAAVGQLAGGVAHEINNPLTGVLNNVQLIGMELDAGKEFKSEEIRELMGVIEESALRCKKITQALLDFSHVSKAVFCPVSLNDIAKRALVLISPKLTPENIAIKQDFEPDIPMISGDPQLLKQVILELVLNAQWAISQKSGQASNNITIKTWYDSKERSVFISVADTGIGIPENIIPRIFEPFFTTKDVGKGTGLGLALVYNVIDSHKGSIKVESRLDLGTIFKIRLPVA
jgi:signal transduction histidine kinase